MSQSARSKTAKKLQSFNDQPPTWIPDNLRALITRWTGGDSYTAQLLRGLAWKYRVFIVLSLVANIAAGFFEGGTMAVFTAALEFVGGDGEIVNNLGFLTPILKQIEARFDAGGVFFTLILTTVLMQIGRSWFDFLAQSAVAYLSSWSEGDLRRRLFAQFTSLSYANVSRYKVGDLSSFVGEVDRVGILITTANQFMSHLMIVLSYTTVLLWLSWQMTLIAVVALFLLSFSLQRIRTGIRERSKEFVKAYVSINTRIVEFLSGMRLLHTFGRQQFARDNITSTIDQSVRARRQAIILSATIPAIVQSLTIIGVAIFLSVGYFLFQRTGDSSLIPRLITFVFIVYRMLPRVTGLNSALATISENIPFATRIANHLRPDDKEYLDAGTVPFTQLKETITFDKISLSYAGTQQDAIKALSLTIKRGQMIAFVGSSGSGKSSLVSLLLRLYDPTQGKILVDGVDLHELRRDDWLSRIGIVDQDTFVLHDSVRENVRFGRLDATDAEIIEACKIANAHDFILELNAGYDTIVGDRGQRLSGGQRQRLAIARAVLRDPDILILDEATSALDSHSERQIQDAVENLRNERTVIVVAHRLSTIARADVIVVMHDGQIVESGTQNELLVTNSRYRSMWQLQSV